jgi:hypothetical protein
VPPGHSRSYMGSRGSQHTCVAADSPRRVPINSRQRHGRLPNGPDVQLRPTAAGGAGCSATIHVRRLTQAIEKRCVMAAETARWTTLAHSALAG